MTSTSAAQQPEGQGRFVHVASPAGGGALPEAERRRVLVATLATLMAVNALDVLSSALGGQWHDLAVALATIGLFGALVVWARRHDVDRAGVAILYAILAVNLGSLAAGQGVRDLNIVLLPAGITLAALLLEARRVAIFTLATILGTAVIGLIKVDGLLASPPLRAGPWHVFGLSLLLSVSALITWFVVRGLRAALGRASAGERSFREILDATSEAIVLHDADDGRILDVNRAMLAMFGMTRQEALGAAVADLTDGDRAEAAAGALARIHQAVEAGPQAFEWRCRSLTGRSFWGEVSLRSSEIGGRGRVLAVIRDVDERRRLQDRLREAEKLEAIGRLAGGVAHDFNNQLTGIVGNAEVLRERPLEQEAADCVDGILVASGRAAALTRQLLAFARRGKVESVAVDLNALVREVAALLSRSIDRRVALAIRLADRPLWTMGDPSQLSNALLNLGLNARDAMPGGGRLSFVTERVTLDAAACGRLPFDLTPGPHVRVEVSDGGEGIPPEVLSRVFEPFFTTKAHGTGLGLAAVYGTVRNHGGAVEIQSRRGEGTTVTLLLPASEPPVPALLPSAARPAEGRGRILVVDDEPVVADVARRLLERHGYQVVATTSAREGLAAFRRAPASFDAALLDLDQPGMRGDALGEALRGLAPGLPVVLVTGLGDQAGPAQPDGPPLLRKPFSASELVEAVQRAIQGRPAGSSPRAG